MMRRSAAGDHCTRLGFILLIDVIGIGRAVSRNLDHHGRRLDRPELREISLGQAGGALELVAGKH